MFDILNKILLQSITTQKKQLSFQDRVDMWEDLRQPRSARKSSTYYQNFQADDNRMYKMFCKNCNLALRPEIRQKKNPNDQLKIMGGIEDQKSIKQIWMLKSFKDNKKEIVNFSTDLVITSDNGSVKLEQGGSKGSRFEIQQIKQRGKQRQIRIKDGAGMYLTLDGTLEISKLDEQDDSQVYYVKEILKQKYEQFETTFMIINPQTKKCLDVAKGDKSIGASVGIWEINQRVNQRWTLDPPLRDDAPEDVKYSIINMHSGLRLWYNKKKELIQNDNQQKIWQFAKKHSNSGELYCTELKKFVNRVEEDKIKLSSSSNGTKWEVT